MTFRRTFITNGACAVFFVGTALAAPSSPAAMPVYRESLKQAEDAALAHSPRVQAARAEAEAAHAGAKSQFATLWPRLSFDASYRRVSEVPNFAPVPNGPAIRFGDNKNYSYGPAVNWMIESGGTYYRWQSALAFWRAKESELDFAERQLTLEVRLNYFQVQLGIEQIRNLVESLKLSQAQYRDIALRYRAGASSRLDSLSAHQEVLNRRRLLRQAQADLANALQTLFTVTGSTPPAELSVPIEMGLVNSVPPETDAPTLAVALDPLATSEQALGRAAKQSFDEHHPQLVALSEQILASQASVSSLKSGHYPFVQLNAKISRDYPNGPVLESINQKTVGVFASLPIFEFGRVSQNVAEQKSLTLATEQRRAQTVQDLWRDWQRARDQWLGLNAQKPIFEESLVETKKIQSLTYESYKAGQVSFLEVQNTNLRVLESEVASARNDVELLIQLAILDSLSVKE